MVHRPSTAEVRGAGAADAYTAFVRQTVVTAQAAGVLRRDIAARLLTLSLLNLLNWTAVW